MNYYCVRYLVSLQCNFRNKSTGWCHGKCCLIIWAFFNTWVQIFIESIAENLLFSCTAISACTKPDTNIIIFLQVVMSQLPLEICCSTSLGLGNHHWQVSVYHWHWLSTTLEMSWKVGSIWGDISFLIHVHLRPNSLWFHLMMISLTESTTLWNT